MFAATHYAWSPTQQYRSKLFSIPLSMVILLLNTIVLLPKYLPASDAALTTTRILIGATAEVGSTDKEGLFNWKSATNVQKTIQKEFGLVQTTSYPAWSTWTGTAQNPKSYNMSDVNKVINWAYENNKKTVIHLLCGSGTYFPSWFNSGTWTNAQLEDLLQSWITEAVTTNNNASKVNYWNVVNEAFTWDGKYWSNQSECRWQQLGWEADQSGLTGNAKVYDQHPVYIRKAFEMTRAKTSAKLELRDYYIEFWDNSVKARAFYQLVKHLINTKTPIDAVGFQGHFRLDRTYDWSSLTKAVSEYKKLGLEVYITEVDYGDTDQIAAAKPSRWSAQMDSAQKKAYHDFTAAAVAGGANWICLWGVADNTNSYWRMGQNALLFNEQYQPKPAYYGFHQGITDGFSGAKPGNHKPLAPEPKRIAPRVTGKKIYMNDIISHYRLFTVSGKPVEAAQFHDNMIDIGPISKGIYILKVFANTSGAHIVKVVR
jgi:GH35 family endo-1,4-beta-xylanase